LIQIKKLNNSIEQAHFIQKLARKLMVREEDLRKELSKVKVDKVEKQEIVEIKDNLSQKEKIEKKFLKLYLINKIDVKEILYLFSPKYRDILEKIAKGEEIEDKGFLSEMFFGADKEKQLLRENEVTASEEIKNCIKNLKRIFLEEKKKNLSLKIKNEKDPKVIERLMEEYLNLIK
jgi:hypothetical protein